MYQYVTLLQGISCLDSCTLTECFYGNRSQLDFADVHNYKHLFSAMPSAPYSECIHHTYEGIW